MHLLSTLELFNETATKSLNRFLKIGQISERTLRKGRKLIRPDLAHRAMGFALSLEDPSLY
jgi:hypothetical protein